MKYHCTGCDYIYDELKWDSHEWIEENTPYIALPNDFFCPFCETHKDDFVMLDEPVFTPIDAYRLTPIEAEHYPLYTIENDILRFEVGQTEHPQTKDHFIYKVALFDDGGDLIEERHFQCDQKAEWSFDLEYIDEFELRVFCSRDGIFSTGILTQ